MGALLPCSWDHEPCGRALLSEPPFHTAVSALAGLRAVAAAASASVSGEAGGGLLHPHALPAAALGGLARKLMARQRRGGPTGNDAVVELSMGESHSFLNTSAAISTVVNDNNQC